MIRARSFLAATLMAAFFSANAAPSHRDLSVGAPPESAKAEASQEKPPTHSEKCPAECKRCTEAVTRALDYLAARQLENGCIPAQDMGLYYVATDRTVTHVMTTAIAGLAFIAGGSTPSKGTYRRELGLIVRYLRESLAEVMGASPRLAGGGGGPIYSAALGLHFFVHVHEKEKDDASAQMARKLVAYLVDCVGDKVGVSTWKKGADGGTVWFVSGVTALVNTSVLALSRARAAGFDVPERLFGLAKDYYAKYWEDNGSLKYDQHDMFPNEPRQGRTITALMVLKALGADGHERYKSAWKYARKNIGKTMSHHTPSLHMTYCAYSFHFFGADDWRKYVETYYDKLIARQKENGSLEKIWDIDKDLLMTPNDTYWGSTYATAHFALILQVTTGNVQLVKAK